ncbi:hypothetical protein F383_29348 [Gossypium arboreum]|uniref:Uncharacterized protein n=1 Tax=Gossypium arboreum TaxID=29729 RepID=A0A0B0P7B5_GOSAR|nr:hypothetical protein F383_29348 [Gossypium arboreum]
MKIRKDRLRKYAVELKTSGSSSGSGRIRSDGHKTTPFKLLFSRHKTVPFCHAIKNPGHWATAVGRAAAVADHCTRWPEVQKVCQMWVAHEEVRGVRGWCA